MGVGVVNPATGGAVTSPNSGVSASSPGVVGTARSATGGVAIPSGLPGPPGKSAYEVAVENGFTGSKADWLAEIEGPPGPPGPISDPGDIPSMKLIFENGLF